MPETKLSALANTAGYALTDRFLHTSGPAETPATENGTLAQLIEALGVYMPPSTIGAAPAYAGVRTITASGPITAADNGYLLVVVVTNSSDITVTFDGVISSGFKCRVVRHATPSNVIGRVLLAGSGDGITHYFSPRNQILTHGGALDVQLGSTAGNERRWSTPGDDGAADGLLAAPRAATLVIGHESNGDTLENCDYLALTTDAEGEAIAAAIADLNARTPSGGVIALRPGFYDCRQRTTPIEVSSAILLRAATQNTLYYQGFGDPDGGNTMLRIGNQRELFTSLLAPPDIGVLSTENLVFVAEIIDTDPGAIPVAGTSIFTTYGPVRRCSFIMPSGTDVAETLEWAVISYDSVEDCRVIGAANGQAGDTTLGGIQTPVSRRNAVNGTDIGIEMPSAEVCENCEVNVASLGILVPPDPGTHACTVHNNRVRVDGGDLSGVGYGIRIDAGNGRVAITSNTLLKNNGNDLYGIYLTDISMSQPFLGNNNIQGYDTDIFIGASVDNARLRGNAYATLTDNAADTDYGEIGGPVRGTRDFSLADHYVAPSSGTFRGETTVFSACAAVRPFAIPTAMEVIFGNFQLFASLGGWFVGVDANAWRMGVGQQSDGSMAISGSTGPYEALEGYRYAGFIDRTFLLTLVSDGTNAHLYVNENLAKTLTPASGFERADATLFAMAGRNNSVGNPAPLVSASLLACAYNAVEVTADQVRQHYRDCRAANRFVPGPFSGGSVGVVAPDGTLSFLDTAGTLTLETAASRW